MMQIISVSLALQLRHIDILHKIHIEEGIIYIKLENSPLAIELKTKHRTNGDGIYHRTKSLMKFNTRLLVKPLAIRRALYRAIEPSGFCLMRNTHLCCLLDSAPVLGE